MTRTPKAVVSQNIEFCDCGQVGKPVLTLDGMRKSLCFSCLLKEFQGMRHEDTQTVSPYSPARRSGR